jgi:hypothetical protein
MDGLFVSHTEVPSAFIKSISNVDYEVFLGPIELYDWDGQSFFDVNTWHNTKSSNPESKEA